MLFEYTQAMAQAGRPCRVLRSSTRIANQAPMERIGQLEEIAAAESLLVRPDGAWMNSQHSRQWRFACLQY